MLKINNKYDVIILGSGPSGCACAIRCAELGLKTLCIDNLAVDQSPKPLPGIYNHAASLEIIALLESAKLYNSVVNDCNLHGIYIENISLNLSQLIQRKNSILKKINSMVVQKLADHNVDFIHGKAKALNSSTIEISSTLLEKNNLITTKNIVLATESCPISIPCALVDNEYIFDSISALNLFEVPKRLAILGAGVNGLEIAGIWNRLGSEVILLDAQETFLNLTDHQISREAYKIFTEQGLELRLGTRVISTKIINKKVTIEYQDSDGNHAIRVDKLIVASGRKPKSENVMAPEANLLLDESGFVHINEKYRTNLPNVYAIGDLTLYGPMLAHKGITEGIFVAEQIAGIQSPKIDYDFLPNVIYTEPEIAWVGHTEQAIKAKRDSIKVGTYSLNKNTKAISVDKTDGLVKIISCTKTDTLLGVHIIASNASELIAESVLALEFSANNEDIMKTVHPHPCFSESFYEAVSLNKK